MYSGQPAWDPYTGRLLHPQGQVNGPNQPYRQAQYAPQQLPYQPYQQAPSPVPGSYYGYQAPYQVPPPQGFYQGPYNIAGYMPQQGPPRPQIPYYQGPYAAPAAIKADLTDQEQDAIMFSALNRLNEECEAARKEDRKVKMRLSEMQKDCIKKFPHHQQRLNWLYLEFSQHMRDLDTKPAHGLRPRGRGVNRGRPNQNFCLPPSEQHASDEIRKLRDENTRLIQALEREKGADEN